MKYLKTYEGLFWKKLVDMNWNEDECNTFIKLGFRKIDSGFMNSTQECWTIFRGYVYSPKNSDITRIEVYKKAKHMPGLEGLVFKHYLLKLFYGKKFKSYKFGRYKFDDMLEFIKSNIPFDIDIKKYNL